MRVCYLDLEVVDCTADPHILGYDAVEKMLEDVLKVCESDVVRGINVVRLYMGKILTIIGEDEEEREVYEEEYESDYYSDPITEEDFRKVAKGPYAKKHKVEGLVYKYDSPYDRLTKKTYRTCDGRTVEVTRGPLPIGLTGVKKAIEMIRERLRKDPNFRDFKLEIGVVWDEFGQHNCSDYITVEGTTMTVDYSNQDWYKGERNYMRHIRRLARVLGVDPKVLLSE